MVQLAVWLTAEPIRRQGMVKALRSLARSAQLERGCQSSHVYEEAGRPEALCYVEDWATAEDLNRQLGSDRVARLFSVMEGAMEPPVLEFRFVSETRGMDYVTAQREAAKED